MPQEMQCDLNSCKVGGRGRGQGAQLSWTSFSSLSVLARVFSSNSFHDPVGVYQQIDTRPSLKGGVIYDEHDLKFAKIILNANLENSAGT